MIELESAVVTLIDKGFTVHAPRGKASLDSYSMAGDDIRIPLETIECRIQLFYARFNWLDPRGEVCVLSESSLQAYNHDLRLDKSALALPAYELSLHPVWQDKCEVRLSGYSDDPDWTRLKIIKAHTLICASQSERLRALDSAVHYTLRMN